MTNSTCEVAGCTGSRILFSSAFYFYNPTFTSAGPDASILISLKALGTASKLHKSLRLVSLMSPLPTRMWIEQVNCENRQQACLGTGRRGVHREGATATTKQSSVQLETAFTKTIPGEGNGNLLQYSCLGSPMDRGAWWATVHGVERVGHNWATNTFTFIPWRAAVDSHLRSTPDPRATDNLYLKGDTGFINKKQT